MATAPSLDDIKKTIWTLRPDVQTFCQDDPARFEWWLSLHGCHEHPALIAAGYRVPEAILDAPAPPPWTDEIIPTDRPAFGRLMALAWSSDPQARQSFDPTTPAGRAEAVWWFVTQVAPGMGFQRVLSPAQRRVLGTPDPRFVGAEFQPITRLMAALWERHPALRQAFPLTTPAGRAGFLVWLLTTGWATLGLLDALTPADVAAALSAAPGSDPDHPTPRVLAMIASVDPAFKAALTKARIVTWDDWRHAMETAGEGTTEEGEGTTLSRAEDRHPILGWLRAAAHQSASSAAAHQSAPSAPAIITAANRTLAPGVNLIGHARSQSGVGEEVRMAALALAAAGIPFTIHDIGSGPEGEGGGDTSVTTSPLSAQRRYAVDILCATGLESARLSTTEGTRLFDGRPIIGNWPWELPAWPEAWRHAYALVDEVWAATRFSYGAFAASCPKPVRHMPTAVDVTATEGRTRRDFALPENRFLFVFSFDAASSLARKNPLACARAFRAAFPRGDEPVGLVIKTVRMAATDPAWLALAAIIDGDDRVVLIKETLSRGGVLDLYRVSDCFLSLHRSEGFGRSIAEAMMLGKPVIVTGHSGNMDFTPPGAAALVDHRPRVVGPGDYPFGEGMIWAEPDADHAAWWMRRMLDEPDWRHELAARGAALTRGILSPRAVGAHYAAVLATLVGVPIRPPTLDTPVSPGNSARRP